jgi:hypothetical protein
MLSKTPGFRRCTRYKLTWSTRSDCPAYIAMHEFDGVNLPMDNIMKTGETEWAKRQLGAAKALEAPIWKLEGEFGDKLIGGF